MIAAILTLFALAMFGAVMSPLAVLATGTVAVALTYRAVTS